MPAPKHNQYAAKEEGEKLSSRLWINVTRAEKAQIVRQAGGEKLSTWLRPRVLQALGVEGQNDERSDRP